MNYSYVYPCIIIIKKCFCYSSLLKDDMAVGVCLIPTVSIMYKWKGEVIEDTEALMVIQKYVMKNIV